MGLFDDAASLLGKNEQEALAKREAEQSKSIPWSSDWSKELVAALESYGIAPLPCYVTGGFDVEVQTEYWDTAWALRGWKEEYDYGKRSVDILMKPDGTLWHSDFALLACLEFRAINQGSAPGWIDRISNGRRSAFVGVREGHHSALMRMNYAPESVAFWARELRSIYKTPEELRELVGVPVAAALKSGVKPVSGWLIGIQ